MATDVACPTQNARSNCILSRTW